jgi:hypothetical protein
MVDAWWIHALGFRPKSLFRPGHHAAQGRSPNWTAAAFVARMLSPMWVESPLMPDSPIKVEKVLAELNRLRTDLDKDPTDPEWFALHHAFCFVSYKIGEFQAYLDETVKPGEHPED